MNEIFLGHESHHSARYRIAVGGREERPPSSGVIVATGIGATGWARSIHRERRAPQALPGAADPPPAFFVREVFPSVATSTEVPAGLLGGEETLGLVSEMNEGSVVFGDGIEADRLALAWGMRATVGVAPERLRLVRG